jgi:hypothetical protein
MINEKMLHDIRDGVSKVAADVVWTPEEILMLRDVVTRVKPSEIENRFYSSLMCYEKVDPVQWEAMRKKLDRLGDHLKQLILYLRREERDNFELAERIRNSIIMHPQQEQQKQLVGVRLCSHQVPVNQDCTACEDTEYAYSHEGD